MGKMFVTPGSGYARGAAQDAKAAADREAELAKQLQAERAPYVANLQSLLPSLQSVLTQNNVDPNSFSLTRRTGAGTTAASPTLSRVNTDLVMPDINASTFDVPDSKQIGNELATAYGAMSNINLQKANAERSAQAKTSLSKRGLTNSSYGMNQQIGLENLKAIEGTKMRAEGVSVRQNAEATARGEARTAALGLYGAQSDRALALRSDELNKLLQNNAISQADYNNAINEINMENSIRSTEAQVRAALRAENVNNLLSYTGVLQSGANPSAVINTTQGVTNSMMNVANMYNQIAAQNAQMFSSIMTGVGTLYGMFGGGLGSGSVGGSAGSYTNYMPSGSSSPRMGSGG